MKLLQTHRIRIATKTALCYAALQFSTRIMDCDGLSLAVCEFCVATDVVAKRVPRSMAPIVNDDARRSINGDDVVDIDNDVDDNDDQIDISRTRLLFR